MHFTNVIFFFFKQTAWGRIGQLLWEAHTATEGRARVAREGNVLFDFALWCTHIITHYFIVILKIAPKGYCELEAGGRGWQAATCARSTKGLCFSLFPLYVSLLYSDANVSKLIPFFVYAYIASTAAFYLRGAKFAGGAKGTNYLYSFNVIFYFLWFILVTALLWIYCERAHNVCHTHYSH